MSYHLPLIAFLDSLSDRHLHADGWWKEPSLVPADGVGGCLCDVCCGPWLIFVSL